MALLEHYRQYLANPTAEALASECSLNYVPTTTSLSQPNAILRHIQAQHALVQKKKEKFLNVIEGTNALCLETETTLSFEQGGGTYLPGLDDNFITGKEVTLPITHIVIFDTESKIQQIRLLWDQGCLLKAVETIGARGRNWPIRDGTDQVKMIASSAAAAPTPTAPAERTGRLRGTDPHSSLALFAPAQVPERGHSPQHSVAPRASAKPPPREYSELFVDGTPPASPEPAGGAMSPSKRNRENSNPLKSGAGKHYHASRLFDQENEPSKEERGIKTDSRKYQHFEFGEAEFKPNNKIADLKSKHRSQWNFEDFTTPEKPKPRKLSHNKTSYDWQSEDPNASKPPVFRQPKPQPRPDADAHFRIDDPAASSEEPSSRPMSSKSSNGRYEDNIGAFDGAPDQNQRELPLRNIANPNLNKTFSSSWELADKSPAAKNISSNENGNSRSTGSVRNKPGLQPSYDLFDSSAAPAPQRGIKIAGDSMGMSRGMRGEENREWWDHASEK